MGSYFSTLLDYAPSLSSLSFGLWPSTKTTDVNDHANYKIKLTRKSANNTYNYMRYDTGYNNKGNDGNDKNDVNEDDEEMFGPCLCIEPSGYYYFSKSTLQFELGIPGHEQGMYETSPHHQGKYYPYYYLNDTFSINNYRINYFATALSKQSFDKLGIMGSLESLSSLRLIGQIDGQANDQKDGQINGLSNNSIYSQSKYGNLWILKEDSDNNPCDFNQQDIDWMNSILENE
jgi:hypothetical protein